MHARELGCDTQVGGGSAGGFNIRYGAIGYAVMDINTKGVVKLYAKPHPNKEAPEDLHSSINEFVDTSEELELTSAPINSHGALADKVEDLPISQLKQFMDRAVSLIREAYYEPYLEQEYLGLTGAMAE